MPVLANISGDGAGEAWLAGALERLRAVAHLLTTGASSDELATSIADEVVAAASAATATIVRFRDGSAEVVATSGAAPWPDPGATAVELASLPILGQVVAGTAVYCSDRAERITAHGATAAGPEAVEASAVLPALHADTVIGALVVGWKEAGRFTPVERQYLEVLASMASAALGGPGLEVDRNERALLSTLFASAPVGIALIDEHLRFQRVNPTMAEMNGLPAEAHLGNPVFDVLPDLRATAEPILRHVIDSGEPLVNVEIAGTTPAAPGQHRQWLESFFPVVTSDGGPVGLAAIATEITERKALEAALSANEARLRTVFSAIDEGYCVCEIVLDDEGNAVDYRFLEVNPRFEERTGLVDPVGRTALEMLPDLEPTWVETYARAALDKVPLRFQERSEVMGRDFDVFVTPVEPHGHFAIVFNDVTDRMATEAALRESEARFRNMADHAPVMMWVTEADGHCSYLNQTWLEFTGQTPEAGLGYGWLDATHPEDRPRVEAAFREANRRKAPFRVEYRLRRHDGEYRWAIDAAAPRLDGDGRYLGSIGSVIDITERKQAEESLAARHAAEHQVAVRLQASLLPSVQPLRDDVELAARYVAATSNLEVGGDWYESFDLSDGRVGIVVGDVVGHNIEAAAAMGQLRAGFLALATRTDEPDELLVALDQFASRNRITDFATAACATLDPMTGVLHHASAGHPPLLVVDPEGRTTWLDDATSAPLGVLAVGSRPRAAVTLRPGSLLVACSDGLVERRSASIDVGLDALADAAARHRAAPIGDVADRIVADLADGAEFEDDVVLLCLRLPPLDAHRFRRVIPADVGELADLRRQVRAWLTDRSVSDLHRDDVLLAISEACNNAILHAYDGRAPGVVSVAVTDHGEGGLEVRVADIGAWRSSPPDGIGGRGTGIMDALSTHYARRTGPGGTTIEMRLPTS